MPITGYANTVRFCAGCGADLPRWVRLRLEELEDDKPALLDFGLEVVTRLCETLLRNGAPGCTSTPSTRPTRRCGCGRTWRCPCLRERERLDGEAALPHLKKDLAEAGNESNETEDAGQSAFSLRASTAIFQNKLANSIFS